MKFTTRVNLVLVTLAIILAGCDSNAIVDTEGPEAVSGAYIKKVSSVPLGAFLPAGEVGGGVLTPGDFFPPTGINVSKIIRTRDFVEYTIQTTGLPAGAYTIWFIPINKPYKCLTTPCGEEDVFARTDIVDASVYWSTGAVVKEDGHGYFKERMYKGVLPSGPDQIAWPGSGLLNTMGAEIHLIVKYHGPVSSDPDVFYDQTHTLLGSCDEGANAFYAGPVFGVQCFDPQVAVHSP